MITVKDVLGLVQTYDKSTMNPNDGTSCFYTDPDDPSKHCIAGRLLFDLGFELPDLEDGMNTSAFATWAEYQDLYAHFEVDAIGFIELLQFYADRSSAGIYDKAYEDYANKTGNGSWGFAIETAIDNTEKERGVLL